MKKILVTGASGFVGGYLCKLGDIECIPISENSIKIDIRNIDRVTRRIAEVNPDAIVHLAAQSFVPRSFEDPQETFDINFMGTFSLLSALKNVNFDGRMLFVSPGDVYGLVDIESLPVTEFSPPRPRNPYSVSKIAAEALCYQWSQTARFEILIARPFNHIGPGQSERFVISDFSKQIMEIKFGLREPILRVGDIDVTRDFTDVRDIANAYAMMLLTAENGEIYNVCSGKEQNLRHLLELMLDLTQVDAEIRIDKTRLRPSEQRRIWGDYSKLHKDTGWSPRIPLEKTLQDTLACWGNILS